MKRIIFRVTPYAHSVGWRITARGRVLAWRVVKAQAVELARLWARRSWRTDGKPSQLVVHKLDGTIAFEHTYGRDPRRTRG